MNPLKLLKELINILSSSKQYKHRKMKRVFQWRRYFEWNDLTNKEKLAAKRLLLIPIAAYFILMFIHQYIFSIVLLLCIYFAYKKFEKGKLMK